jgi:hypothetical protein
MTDFEHDPSKFSYSFTPALVVLEDEKGVEKVSVANFTERDTGSLYCTQWDGERWLAPRWRWAEVRFIETEVVTDDDGAPVGKRITDDDWHLLPDAVVESAEADAAEVEIQ